MENQAQLSSPTEQDESVRCYMCGNIDNLEYCSSCGHPLKRMKEEVGVLLFLLEVIRDIITPLATGITTFCLFLFQPNKGYEAVFSGIETHSTSTTVEKIKLPLITSFWQKILNKKQKIFEPSGYLVFAAIIYLYVYKSSSLSELPTSSPSFDNIPPFLKGAFQEVESIKIFAIILLACMFFAVLTKIIYNKLSWSNAYALSIYLNGTNSLIFSFWFLFFQIINYVFSDSPILWFIFFLTSPFVVLLMLLIHGIVSPLRFLPKALKIPHSRLIAIFFIGYISFPLILFASALLVEFIDSNIGGSGIYTQVCCVGFFAIFFAITSFLPKLFRVITNTKPSRN